MGSERSLRSDRLSVDVRDASEREEGSDLSSPRKSLSSSSSSSSIEVWKRTERGRDEEDAVLDCDAESADAGATFDDEDANELFEGTRVAVARGRGRGVCCSDSEFERRGERAGEVAR